MKRLSTGIAFALGFGLAASYVVAQSLVDQGKPGKQGPWPVSVISQAPSSSPSLGIFGAQKVAQETPLEALTFQYSINPEFVTTTTADGGTVTQANSSAVMTTGTNDGGYAEIKSRHLTRYVPGQGIRIRFTATYTACAADSVQEVGLANTTDFLGFGCINDVFGIIHRVGGNQTFVPQASWNGDAITFDITKGNVFSAAFQWLGYGVQRLIVERPNGDFATVHTFQFPNSRTTPTFANPALRFVARAYNTGNTSSLVLTTPSVGIVTEGLVANGGVHRGALNRRVVSTAPLSVFGLRNNSTWGDAGVENMVRVRVLDVHTSGTGAGDVNCWLLQEAAISPAPAWRNTDLSRSVSATDIDGGAPDGGVVRHAWVFEGNAGGNTADIGDIHLEPGESLSVVCYTISGNSTVGVAVNWLEEF